MAVLIVFVALTLVAFLVYAGAAKLERRAERWERYEKFMHPPDDDGDGVTLLEEDHDEDSR